MDHELRQRLIGAVVVTALCAIFIPMLFDDPVDTSGQLVSELSIPAPANSSAVTDKLPTSAEQVLKPAELEPLSTEDASDSIQSSEMVEPEANALKQGRAGESLYAESEGYDGSSAEEAVELEPSVPKALPQKFPVGKPLSPKAVKDITPKVVIKETPVKAVEPAVKKLPVPAKTADADVVKQSSSAQKIANAVAAKKPVVEPPKASAKLERWYIQLGSFSKKDNAMTLWNSLHDQGLPVSLDAVQTDKGTTYRLRVGPELDKKKAQAMKSRLDKQNIEAILIAE